MFRALSGTPCPVPISASPLPSFDDDITATTTIEFTSAFNAGSLIRDTKPRRLRNAAGSVVKARKGDNGGVKFAIHEDIPVAAESRKNGNCQPTRQSTMISQPPQRPKTKKRDSVVYEVAPDAPQPVSIPLPHSNGFNRQERPATFSMAKSVRSQSQTIAATGNKLNVMPRRPPTSVKLQENLTIALPEYTEPTTVMKPPRRGTIYIPNEDTTMPSMYMGIFSPIKHVSSGTLAEVQPHESEMKPGMDMEVTGIAAQMAAKKRTRGPRASMITLSPKRGRGPLQTSSRNLQEAAVQEDRVGSGPGKENVPPGHGQGYQGSFSGKKTDKSAVDIGVRDHGGRPSTSGSASTLSRPTASSTGRQTEKKTASRTTRPIWKAPTNVGSRINNAQTIHAQAWASTPFESQAAHEHEVVSKKTSVPSRFVIPSLKPEMMIDVAYPLLTDDLACPAMYEDNWLSHQEAAITQLVNNLFTASSQTSGSGEDDGMLRIRLLEMYGSTVNEVLYKRLQAALLYGALSVPSEVLKGAVWLSTDLGKRNAFADMWLDTYDLTCLRAALEVVVGRQCGAGAKADTSRRSLRNFIEAFLIHNEDGKSEFYTEGREAWSYHRTLLRSMMVIKILDMTKTTTPQIVSECLFRSSSTYKTSAAVVRGLFQRLNPSAGDPIRALSHIGYNVTHEQYPLEEYTYRLENLAVDLRDGVRLTRLVELLLYPSASGILDHADSTTTVVLPTGEELSLVEGQMQWPLSQHLKFSCISRAAKLYNVQIALSALQGVKGMGGLVQNVQAEDIVDGFREKTVKLLWGVTSKWGLGALIDCHDVEREIKRLCRISGDYDNDFFHAIGDEDEDEYDHARYKRLLKAWAQAVARRKSLVVKNLTTSFADGRVFEAIVDEYEGYINHPSALDKGQQLSGRLRRLGCSEQFSGLFAKGQESQRCAHVFDRDFVLAALSFLCSRLLAPTQGVRAAVTIQRAWRSHWNRTVVSRKSCLKTVAQSCAEAVLGREKDQNGGIAKVAQKLSEKDEAVSQEEDLWLNL